MSLKGIIKGSVNAVNNFLFRYKKFGGNVTRLKSVYENTFTDDNGNAIDLLAYKGKKLLIVNTASACGYTYQYDDLEKLQLANKSALNVVAFPCNDFGRQEEGTDAEIQSFCKVNFGVTFPVMKKTAIRFPTEHNIFNWLSNPALNGWNDKKPMWNFWKYLLDENGKLIAVFPSRYKPMGGVLMNIIKSSK